MGTALKTRIIKIGNSQGIRIPKILLEQSGLGAEIEIEVKDNCLILRPAPQVRSNWAQAFADMAEQQDDALLDGALLDGAIATDWDRDEWEW